MTPTLTSAAPQAMGFNGFFKGAFSYHFHNFWQVPCLISEFSTSYAMLRLGGNLVTLRETGLT
jgi:hypothetical protein